MLAPPPPPRIRKERGGLLSTLSGLLTFFVVGAVALIVGVVFVEKQANEPGPLAADKIVLIPKSIGTGEIADPAQARRRHQPDLPVRAPGLPQPAARKPEGGRVPVPRPRQHRRGDRHAHRRQGDPALAHRPGGADERADRAAHPRQRHPDRRRHRDAARGHAPARHLQVRARQTRQQARQPHAAGAARGAEPDLGAALAGPADQDARRSSSSSPRSSRRRPAAPTSARASPACSSTGSAAA